MLKIILLDWVKNNVASSRPYGSDWFYPKQGLLQLLKRCNSLKATEFSIVLVINDSNLVSEYDYLKGHFNIDDVIYNSSNIGHDWGGYNFGINHLRQHNFNGDVIMMNSACLGPLTYNWLDIYQELFHQDDTTGAVGATYCANNISIKSQVLEPHLQSYFLYSNMAVMNHVFPDQLPYPESVNKIDIIKKGEIEFSNQLLSFGYSIKAKLNRFCHSNQSPWQFESINGDPKVNHDKWVPYSI